MKIQQACDSVGVPVDNYWYYRRELKKANMLDSPASEEKNPKTDPFHIPKELDPVIKVFLQDATFALTEGTFRAEEGQMSFEGKGTIKFDNK